MAMTIYDRFYLPLPRLFHALLLLCHFHESSISDHLFVIRQKRSHVGKYEEYEEITKPSLLLPSRYCAH